MFDPSRIQVFDWPHYFGFHANLPAALMTAALEVARVHPTSPECVWAGDPGVPATVPVYDETGEKVGSEPNPAGPQPYDTAFLLFVDEAEARALMGEHWIETDAGA